MNHSQDYGDDTTDVDGEVESVTDIIDQDIMNHQAEFLEEGLLARNIWKNVSDALDDGWSVDEVNLGSYASTHLSGLQYQVRSNTYQSRCKSKTE